MRVAIVGSRETKGLQKAAILSRIPPECTEIVSGGARGVDSMAREIAREKGYAYTEFLPDYDLYGRRATLLRNRQIVDYSDCVLAFWDYRSNGTRHTILYCLQVNKPVQVIMIA